MLNRIQKGTNVYAEYQLPSGVEIDNNSMMMINANRENGICFAPIQIEENNGVKEKMLFDVTSMISMEEYLTEYISQDEFKRMISNLIDSIESFDEYMIDLRQVQLQLDTVFINKLNNHVAFLCFALKDTEQTSDIYAFFYDLVTKCKVRVTVNETSYWHCVLNIVQNKNGFSLQNMRDAMASLTNGGAAVAQSAVQRNDVQANVPNVPVNTPAPIPFDNSSTITVSSHPVMPMGADPIVPMPDANEKKGLFGGLFGGKKKAEKSAASEKPEKKAKSEKKEKTPKPAKAAQKGGLASRLGTEPSKGRVYRGEDAALDENAAITALQQPVAPIVPPQPNFDFGGTTVLRDPNQITEAVPMPEMAPQTDVMSMTQPVGSLPSLSPIPSDPPVQPIQPITPIAPIPQSVSSMSFGASSSTSGSLPVVDPQQDIESCSTTILRDTENVETTVLRHNSAFLICLRNNQKISLNNAVVRFGRDRNDIDFDMHWNTNVGHLHANIVERDGKHYLVDLNSRNHTYINQTPVAPQQENLLCDRDMIELADEKFQFFEQ